MKRCLSGIKPTGQLTLGNYIGAIKQFVKLQDEYEMYIFIANLHALTVRQDKKELKKNTKDLIALYLACGLDPNKVTLFLQSDVASQSELGWIMTCNSYIGELNRMTQYKDQVAKENQNITAGLYTYPSLMAADILLYDADVVPVGVDQKQHIELTRTLAQRFNNAYGDTFKIPEPIVPEVGAKIMSLQDPTKKMSKSDEHPKGCIYLLDDPKQARNKILSAVTDSIGKINYDVENQPGISNLITIMASLSNQSIEQVVETFKNADYKTFKIAVGDKVYDELVSLQAKYQAIMNSNVLEEVLNNGKEKASYLGMKKMRKVRKRLGLDIF